MSMSGADLGRAHGFLDKWRNSRSVDGAMASRASLYASPVLETGSQQERPSLMEPAVQDAQGPIVVTGDDDQPMDGADASIEPVEFTSKFRKPA